MYLMVRALFRESLWFLGNGAEKPPLYRKEVLGLESGVRRGDRGLVAGGQPARAQLLLAALAAVVGVGSFLLGTLSRPMW